MMSSRMKWNLVGHEFRSACGRFIIRRFCMNLKWSGYWGLTDTTTGKRNEQDGGHVADILRMS